MATAAHRKSATQSFSLPPVLLGRLRAFSEERGASLSEVVREALERHLHEEAEVEALGDTGLRVSAKLDRDPFVQRRNDLGPQFYDRPAWLPQPPPPPKRPKVVYLHGFVGIDLGSKPWSEPMYDRFCDWLPAEVSRLWAWETQRLEAMGITPNGMKPVPRFGNGMVDPRQGR